MISEEDMERYQGAAFSRGDDFIYVPPSVLLQPYISCYTITFPRDMPDEYTILPSASSTIVISVGENKVIKTLRGVNTESFNAGKHANKMKLLLLIEFHSGCLFPFIGVDQCELADVSLELGDIDKSLAQEIENVLIRSQSVETLIASLDRIFLNRLRDVHADKTIIAMRNTILSIFWGISNDCYTDVTFWRALCGSD